MTFNSSKKFKKSSLMIVFFSLIIYIFLFSFTKILIDPYGEFNFIEWKINKNKYFTNHKVTPFLLSKRLNNKTTVVFGTSRSALIDESMIDNNVVNFSSSLYGNPIDIYYFLLNLEESKVKNIEKIFFLVDYHIFKEKDSFYYDNRYRENSFFYKIYHSLRSFNIRSIVDGFFTIKKNIENDDSYTILNNGVLSHAFDDANDMDNFSNMSAPEPITMNKKSLRYLAKVDEFANNNNISIVYFTSPLYSEFIQKMNINLIINQMREVVRSIGSIYDLRCMPNLSSNSKNFSSPNHAGYYLLKKAVNSLNKEFLVSEKNIDKFYKNKWRECF